MCSYKMSRFSRKLFEFLTKRINKSAILFNASTAIGNATETAQGRILNFQCRTTEKYVNIVKQANKSLVFQNSNTSTLQSPTPMPKQLIDFWHWYQQLTGLDKVELAKQQMIAVQNNLFKCQNQRQDLTRQATFINEKLTEIYNELIQTRRDDPKFVQLTISENKGLQEQSRITKQLNLLENEERDHFTQLATAIKEYHDNQAMNAQKYKYISILASALLTILSLTGSIIYNNKRILDVRNIITQSQSSIENSLNEKFSVIMKRLEHQEKNMVFHSTNSNSSHVKAELPETVINSNAAINDNHSQNLGKLKHNVYYLGIAVFTLYFLQQIFKN